MSRHGSGSWPSPTLLIFAAPAAQEKPGAELPTGFQRKYNRDYHAIFKNDRIASIFEQYIKRDYDLAAAQVGAPADFAAPDLFVPEVEEAPEPFAGRCQSNGRATAVHLRVT